MKNTPCLLVSAALATATLGFALTPAQAQNLVVNGGFEDPANTPAGGYVTYLGGDTFPGWTVGGESVDVHETGHTKAYAGKQSLDLSGFDQPGSITQVVGTTVGTQYILTFQYSAHVYHPYVGDAFAEIFWDGASVDIVHLPPSPDIIDMNWTPAQYLVTASGPSADLSFVSLSPNGGIILDEITLTPAVAAVPEPGAVAFGLLSAGSVIGLISRRRRHQKGRQEDVGGHLR